jgi:hypothetical protein
VAQVVEARHAQLGALQRRQLTAAQRRRVHKRPGSQRRPPRTSRRQRHCPTGSRTRTSREGRPVRISPPPDKPGAAFHAGARAALFGVASLCCCKFAAAQAPGGGQSMRLSPPQASSVRCLRSASA